MLRRFALEERQVVMSANPVFDFLAHFPVFLQELFGILPALAQAFSFKRVPCTVSSGALALDIALGVGGYPRGRIIEVYGPESSGKTTVALHAIAGMINGLVTEAVKKVEGVKDVQVDIVWNPPWDKSRMSRYAKIALGISD